jgi:hypothetical protein
MEFTYRISEAEYLNAAKLRLKGTRRFGTIKTVLFWVFIFVCLMLLLSVVQHHHQQVSPIPDEAVAQTVDSGHVVRAILENIGPFALLIGIWLFMMFRFVPARLRRLYRKDPSMQGQFTVNITPDSLLTQNTAGTSSKTGWNIYDCWREGNGVIMLVFHSGAYFLLSLASLSDAQRNELRGILATALPKKLDFQ